MCRMINNSIFMHRGHRFSGLGAEQAGREGVCWAGFGTVKSKRESSVLKVTPEDTRRSSTVIKI